VALIHAARPAPQGHMTHCRRTTSARPGFVASLRGSARTGAVCFQHGNLGSPYVEPASGPLAFHDVRGLPAAGNRTTATASNTHPVHFAHAFRRVRAESRLSNIAPAAFGEPLRLVTLSLQRELWQHGFVLPACAARPTLFQPGIRALV